VERGNPDGVRAAEPGKPTVRKAELPGGRGMTREANAGRRKATDSGHGILPGDGHEMCPLAAMRTAR